MALFSRLAILVVCLVSIITFVPVPTHTITVSLHLPTFKTAKLDPQEFDCMRANMFFEARNQKSDEAMIAIGYTVLNRIASKKYPDSICGVVQQAKYDAKGRMIRNKCQFSWVCDGKKKVVDVANTLERQAWDRAGTLADAVMRGRVMNPVGNSTMYHADYVKPYWKKAFKQVAIIEQHIFYAPNS